MLFKQKFTIEQNCKLLFNRNSSKSEPQLNWQTGVYILSLTTYNKIQ